MKSPKSYPSLRAVLLGSVLVFAFFSFLGSRGLNEPDEGRYAELGREILVTGDWFTPHLNGFEHFQKPPLIYWATALCFKIFGLNEWAARMPSTLAALGIVALTAWLASHLFGRRLALPAALILSSSLLFFTLARFLTPDMLMSFFIVAAISSLVQINREETDTRLWHWTFFIAMGLGFLTKGPMALVVPLSATAAFQYRLRRDKKSLEIPWVRGILLALLIGISWFLLMVWKYPELLDYFLGYELLQRFGSHVHGRSQPFWYFIPILLIGFLPWALWLPKIIFQFWKRIRFKEQLSPSLWLILGWIIPPFIILSLSGSKLPTYILPLLPAFALGMAYWWQRQNNSFATLLKISLGSLALLLIVSSQVNHLTPILGRQASVRPLIEQLRQSTPHPVVFSAGIRAHGVEFYLRETISICRSDADIVLPVSPEQQQRVFESISEMERAMVGRPESNGLVRLEDFHEFFPSKDWEIIGRAGDFVLIRPRRTH